MLQVLLDEHISPEIAVTAQRSCRSFRVVSIHDWRTGQCVGMPDAELLRAAAEQHLTLLTFDLKTIPKLLRSWADQDIAHGGVIFIDEKSFAQNDVGGIARALCALWRSQGKLNWANRTVFLQTPRT
jgi:hypothetical protein